MDITENVSARVLLKRILVDEPPRTPITNRAFQEPGTSSVRYSARLRQKGSEAQTPRDIVRRSLRQKIRESISKRSLPHVTQRTSSFRSSILIDDGDTPRHLLRNILQTEPIKSPVIHKRGPTKEPEPSSADDAITRTHSGIDLSGLDLPDLTFSNAESTIKVLGRKRPRRSLNVTAFEKRLKDEDDDKEPENLTGDSSLSLSSYPSLSLETPFVDIQTEKKVGLRRRVSSRRKVTVEEFGAAIDKEQIGGMQRSVLEEKTLSDTAHTEGFTLGLTLGLSNLDKPDITTDIVTCSTALYNQPDAMTASMIANQDKSTVMASQLQREIEQSCLRKDESALPGEAEEINPVQVEKESQSGESNSQSDGVPGLSELEEEESLAGSQTEEEMADNQSEDVETSSQAEEEAAAPDCQTEEEGERRTDSQSEEDAAESQSVEAISPSDEEHADPSSHSDEEQIETDFADFQAISQSKNVEAESSSEEDENEAPFQSEDSPNGAEEIEEEREHLKSGLEHIGREDDLAEEDLAQTTAAGWSHLQSKANTSLEAGSPNSCPPHSWKSDQAGPATQEQNISTNQNKSMAEKEESFHLLGLTQDMEDDQDLSDSPPEEAQDQDAAEQEEEWEDEDDDEASDEFSGKTPAFVREKRSFFQPDSPALTPLSKNVQHSVTNKVIPPAKPKQVRRKKTKISTGKAVLSKTYLMSVFRHFSKTKVSSDVYPVLNEIMDTFFDRMAKDLETYAAHAKRKTIDVEDAILLLRRQGYVNDKVPVEVLIEKYLRMEQRKLLIPIATSGNVVVPKKRK